MADDAAPSEAPSKVLFWGCFLALITTAFGFITRALLISTWAEEFDLDPAQAGRLFGIGLWPFAFSIIGFSLFIDRIGYKTSMVISFVGYVVWSVMGVSAFFVAQQGTAEALASGYSLLYWGSLVLGLSNGVVEAYINPVVATMFKAEKTKWLNILHAGWPAGLVVAGLIAIGLDNVSFEVPWWVKIAIIAPPAVVFFLMLIGQKFPVQERVASGVSYRDMVREFGLLGAAIVGFMVTLQLMDFYSNGSTIELSTTQTGIFIAIGVAIVIGFGLYARSLGSPILFVLALIMAPLATTELGTDGWISAIMEDVAKEGGFPAALVLVYTSAIMMVLRFFAGPIVHALSPIGLLIVSSILAILGLYTLSFTTGIVIFVAATLYALGKAFFWPTMLGIVAEQTPRGGALTLNAVGGIGLLAVGTLGGPYIGTLQSARQIEAVAGDAEIAEAVPGLVQEGKLTITETKNIYSIIEYEVISDALLAEKVEAANDSELMAKKIAGVRGASNQRALADMCIFPGVMLIGYLLLGLYFKSRGGYAAETIGEAA